VRPDDAREHERIDELLAGYALGSLEGDDAAEADHLLSSHVPDCLRCRRTLLAFTATAADLALATEPIAPPDTLLPRLHRELEPRRRRFPRTGAVAVGAAAAVVVLGIMLSQSLRLADVQQRNRLMNQVLQYLQRPGATTDRLVAAEDASEAPMSEVAAPDAEHFYLIGTDVPEPPPGTAYGVWLSDGVDAVYAGELPWGPGLRVVRIPFDRSRFDRVLVTVETVGTTPEAPGPPVWEAAA
jgi:hypothetical protein